MRAMARRLLPFRFVLPPLCALALGSCVGEPAGGVALRLDDPQGIFDDGVTLMPAELRVLVLPERACDPATGRVSPEPSTAPGAPVDDAVVDLTIPLGMRSGQRVEVPPGTYTILVRGRGIDRVTTEPNQVIASGCVNDSVTSGGTKGVSITMREVTGTGTCGNSIISPDEQCDDGNATPGDGCSAACQTEGFAINLNDVDAVQRGAAVGWGTGAGDTGRAIVAFGTDNSGFSLGMRFLDDTGRALPSPLDRDVVADNRAGAQLDVSVAVGGGRVLLAYQDAFPNEPASDVRVRSFRIDAPTAGGTAGNEATLATEAAPASMPGAASMGRQAAPSVAVRSDGAGLVVFENPMSPTGLSGRLYPAGATVGAGTEAFVVGTGATGGRSPAVAATSSGFLVAYLAGASVFVQSIDAAGTAGTPVMLATRSGSPEPRLAIGALTTCPASGACALVAFEDAAADAGLNAILVAADASAVGGVFPVVAGAGSEREPAVAGSADRFVVAWTGPDGVRARLFTAAGAPATNRERPSTSDAFLVASGGSEPAIAVGGRGPSYFIAWSDPAQDSAGGVRGRALPF